MGFDRKKILDGLYNVKNNIVFTNYDNAMEFLVDLQVLRIRAEKSDPVFNVKNYVYVIGNEIFYEIKSYLIKEGRQNKLFGINVLIDYYNSKDYRLFKEV